MPREIKFRAWDTADIPFYKEGKPHSRMSYYGPNFTMDDDNGLIAFYTPEGLRGPVGDYNSMIRFILMQYTGLKDKNGTDIYEGDIINHLFHKETFQVVWNEKTASLIALYLEGAVRYSGGVKDKLLAVDSIHYEIIGNIHENSELLK